MFVPSQIVLRQREKFATPERKALLLLLWPPLAAIDNPEAARHYALHKRGEGRGSGGWPNLTGVVGPDHPAWNQEVRLAPRRYPKHQSKIN